MLIVSIYVNNHLLAAHGVVRIKGGSNPDDANTYRLKRTGHRIKHRYGDGAQRLTEKMMRLIHRKGLQDASNLLYPETGR